jgi:hypothetical protein
MVLLSLPFEAHATAAGMIGQRIWDKRVEWLKPAPRASPNRPRKPRAPGVVRIGGPPAIAPAALRLS